jgi:hypothetical protein
MEIQGSWTRVIAIHNSVTAINTPTIGVHRPTRNSIPAQTPIICGIFDRKEDVPVRSMIPKRISKMAVRMR